MTFSGFRRVRCDEDYRLIGVELKHAIVREGSDIDDVFEKRKGKVLQRDMSIFISRSTFPDETMPRPKKVIRNS